MDEVIKICAKYLIIVPVLVELYIFWKLDKNGRREMVKVFLATALLAVILAKLGSHLYNDPRPQFSDGSTPLIPHANDNGFPSDHTLLAATLAFVAYSFNKKLGYSLLGVAVIIGWARVAAHIHHLTDIAGSVVAAAIAYVLVLALIGYLKPAKS